MALYEPVYKPGFTQECFDSCRELLVDNFPNSQTRGIIYEELRTFICKVSALFDLCELWIDGSFVTMKANPKDVDILVMLKVEDFLRCFSDLTLQDTIRKQYPLIDSYFWIYVSDTTFQTMAPADQAAIINKRNYWRGQFGFDREDNPKGVAILNMTELIKVKEMEE